MQFTFWEEPLSDDVSEDSHDASVARIGKAGEYIVAAELELAGYHCSMASEGLPYDLIVEAADGSLCRVQVKTMGKPKSKPLPTGQQWRGYQFKSEPAFCGYKNVDVFAFVALDKRATVYIRAQQATTRSIAIPERRYLDENLRALSLSQAITPG